MEEIESFTSSEAPAQKAASVSQLMDTNGIFANKGLASHSTNGYGFGTKTVVNKTNLNPQVGEFVPTSHDSHEDGNNNNTMGL